jgi:LacI family transcriptional regulator
VAERAGVAVSSASRVVAGHQDVSPRMVARVRAAIEELGYEPNVLAQSLRRGSTMTIGILMRDISSPLFGEIVLGAEVAMQLGPRLGLSAAETETVAWLVRYHLAMSGTAF